MRKGPIDVKIFQGGRTNISYNCLDRHVLEGNGDRTCFIWEGNDPANSSSMTYKEVQEQVCRVVSSGLKLGGRGHAV